ncbi:MAG TPA: hypothetical protein ACFYD4_16255, partial [Candidatus Wunengus sp. YC61]|uniref:hypothetical protein n=1 Tax=Candidatus Wunengus sp. YC61 TaxID=3367698 RepID=UPI0040286BA6
SDERDRNRYVLMKMGIGQNLNHYASSLLYPLASLFTLLRADSARNFLTVGVTVLTDFSLRSK